MLESMLKWVEKNSSGLKPFEASLMKSLGEIIQSAVARKSGKLNKQVLWTGYHALISSTECKKQWAGVC
jgi:hypothetical protein